MSSQSPVDLRQQGNYQFSEGNYEAAVSLYTAALETIAFSDNDDVDTLLTDKNLSFNDIYDKNDETILNLCNRSACYFQMDDFEKALGDALQAWTLSHHSSLKAAYRLAKAQGRLRQYQEAQTTIQTALGIISDMMEKETKDNTESIKTETNDDSSDNEINNNNNSLIKQLTVQQKSFLDLQKQIEQAAKQPVVDYSQETSIKTVKRPVSIKEFIKGKALGYGNFSEVHIVTHKHTHEIFALKSIPKKQAADLAKRQHPNVYNEIQMERRVLMERVPPTCANIIRMYHAFQDYETIYYLMDLHVEWSDLWSQVRRKFDTNSNEKTDNDNNNTTVMVGCYRSQARVWMAQLIDAVEHLHKHGIVHRDLKPENILLNNRGHVVVIDLGTAKDLIQTDLNGPEFVGTPDFMSPEAVKGDSNMSKNNTDDEDQDAENNDDGTNNDNERKNKNKGATHAADLWAVGATLYLLETGQTPFWSPSPYLAFIRIQRGLLARPTGIVDDDAWDLINILMQNDPNKRLGSDAYALHEGVPRTMRKIRPEGYDVIRKHPYFTNVTTKIKSQTPVPSLRDFCILPVAEMACKDAYNLDVCDAHPPGDGSRHDLTRLSPRDRDAVLWVLDRNKLLRDERIWSRFYTDHVASRLDYRIRPNTRDFVGLTQMNDDQGKAPQATMHDPYSKPVAAYPIEFVQIINPLFCKNTNTNCTDEGTRKQYIKLLRRCIATVNKRRPKLVVATGYFDDKCRNLLARISDSIPVIAHDGSAHFSFWLSGVQCIALRDDQVEHDSPQVVWLREQFELSRLAKQPLFVFTNTNPQSLPRRLIKQLARGRTLLLSGISEEIFDTKVKYHANEKVDDASVKSNDSDEGESDEFTMQMVGTQENGLRWFSIEEEPDSWKTNFESITLE